MAEAEISERIYTIPLRICWGSPPKKRSPRAIRLIREFIAKHMKASKDNVRITPKLNELIWRRGIELRIRRVTVKAVKDEETGIVKVGLPDEDLREESK